ncbi:helix-turn-helix transcriptional regulator [Halalkalibacterium halodurans]|uniref:helix-turn-helix transcriptional regulator n=1 Tax=Halalkalibacterium halodurans TaxID=86665 RepID=UPI002E1D66C0|nr:helix-turn-helix transcriptional regulator [Halalkalibacterium halodurans]
MLKERLKYCRKKRNITQEKLAAALSINRSTYAKYETGENEPDNQTLKMLADYFDVSVDFLLGRTDDESPISIAFSHRKDPLTKEEEEYLERQLEEFRQWRKRFQQQDE